MFFSYNIPRQYHSIPLTIITIIIVNGIPRYYRGILYDICDRRSIYFISF